VSVRELRELMGEGIRSLGAWKAYVLFDTERREKEVTLKESGDICW